MSRTARISLSVVLSGTLLIASFGAPAKFAGTGAQDTGALATSPPLIAVEQKPFLSPVTEIATVGDGEAAENIQIPTQGKIEPPEVFWDVPFAVHIPFEIPYSAEFVTVCFDPNIFWEDAPRGNDSIDQIETNNWREWRIQTHGIYRMDDKRLPDNSVQWDVLGSSGKLESMPIWFHDGGARPVWINAKPPPQPNARQNTFMNDSSPYGERRPFDPPSPRALTLSPAQSGWYVFWAAIHPDSLASQGWPEHLRAQDSLKARVRVHYVVMRGTPPREVEEYFFNYSVLPYLFGYGGAPALGSNAGDRLYRAATVEIPITVRRDGWVFDRTELLVKTANAFPIASNRDDARQPFPNEVKTETSLQARGANLRYQRTQFERKDGKLVPTGEELKVEWTPSFPAEIRDNHIADAQLEGSGTLKPKDRPAEDWFTGGIASQFGVYGIIGPDTKRTEFEKSMREYHAKRVSEDEIKSWWFDPPQKDENGRLPSPSKGGAWRSRFWSSWSGTFFKGERRKFLFENAGSHAVLTAGCGPWEVQAFYRRLKDVDAQKPSGNDAAPAAADVDVSDDYWQWLQEFRDGMDEKLQRIQEIRFVLRALYQQWQSTRARWFRLLAMDMQAPLPENDPAQTAAGRRTLEMMKEQKSQLANQMTDLRGQQRALLDEANRIMQDLYESAGVSSVGYRGRHPEIEKLVDHIKDRRDITRLDLYDAGGFYEAQELPQLIEKLEFTSTAVNEVALLMRAKMARARAEILDQRARVVRSSPTFDPKAPFTLAGEVRDAYLEAWRILRDLVRDAPNAREAKAVLQELELKFLGWIVVKLEGERQANLDGLHRYLTERGFSAEDPSGWWDGTWEFVKVWFSSSPISLGARIKEDPDAVAQLVDTIQMEIAANQVSLFAIQRLRRNGVPLDQIAAISPDELSQNITPRASDGSDFPADKAQSLCQDIHATFAALGDLRALANGDADTFSELFSKTYYEVIDADRNWVERASDFFLSPVGLLQFLGPGAIVKAGGKWALHSSRIVAAEEAVTLTEVFLPAARIERIAKALPKQVHEFMTRAIVEDASFLSEISGFESFLRADVGRTVATMLIFGGLAEVAEENNMPLLRHFFDILMNLSGGDKLYHVLSRAGLNPNRLVIKAEKYLATLGKAERQLAEADETISMLETIHRRLVSAPPGPGRKLTEEELSQITSIQKKLLSKRFGQEEVPPDLFSLPDTPGITVVADQDLAMMAATKSLKTGAVKEAESALAGAKSSGIQAKKVVAEQKQLAAKVEEAVTVAAPIPTVVRPIKSLTVQEEILARKAKLFLPESGYPTTEYGHALQLGDEALRKGDFEGAFRAYQNAKALASAHPTTEIHGLINERIGLLARTKSAVVRQNKMRQPQPLREKSNPISADEEARLQDLVKDGRVHLEQVEGGINKAYVVKDDAGNILYFYKKPVPHPQLPADLSATDVPVELAASALGREVGLNVAASRKVGFAQVKVKDAAGVETVIDNMEGVLFHYVPGKTLWDLGEGEVMAMKSELAKQHAFRLWLADADGHWGNIRIGDDGYLWPIDFGMGHLTRQRVVKNRLGSSFAGPEELLENAASFPKDVFRAYKDNPNGSAGVQQYGIMARLEEMLSYDDMKETIDAIQKLAGDKDRLRGLLEESLQNKELAEEALEVLIERASVLGDVMKRRLNEIQKITPQASVMPLPREWRPAKDSVRFVLPPFGIQYSELLSEAA